jgi:hypothetical protein
MSVFTSPFKFLDSYQREDLDIFFGRERETEDLYDALSGVKHLLVYGPSGSGKTSLIECGLRNRFSDADWYALSIRRGVNMTASVFARINEALRLKTQLDPDTKLPIDSDIDFGQVVEQLFDERYKPVYLLFDQFEELLISGEDAEKRDFFARLDRLIRYKVPCRVLLVMREEFIGHLSEFEPLCPSIFQHRFRLEKMGRKGVHEVIEKILAAPHYAGAFIAPAPKVLADKILTKLPDQQREIELTHVQVFLSELWDRAHSEQASALPELHAGLVREEDNLEGVLSSFLRNQLRELDAAYGQNTALELLAAMISERHTKLQVDEATLAAALEKNNITLSRPLPELLRDLERRRILRTLKSGEQAQYEISHDVLARVVGQNLTEEMKLRERAREVYRVYEGRTGLFSREDLDYLRGFEGFWAMPEGMKERVLESERNILRVLEYELSKTKHRDILKNNNKKLSLLTGSLLVFFYLLSFVFNERIVQRIEADNQKQMEIFALSIRSLTDVPDSTFFEKDHTLALNTVQSITGIQIFMLDKENKIIDWRNIGANSDNMNPSEVREYLNGLNNECDTIVFSYPPDIENKILYYNPRILDVKQYLWIQIAITIILFIFAILIVINYNKIVQKQN